MKKVSKVKTGLGELSVKLNDDPYYRGYYIYLHRPNGTKFLAGVIEIDEIEPDGPVLKGWLYGPKEEIPLAEMAFGAETFGRGE